MEELHEQPASEPAPTGPERVMRHNGTAAQKKIEALQAQLAEAKSEIRRLRRDYNGIKQSLEGSARSAQDWKKRYERIRMLWVVQWYWNALDAWNKARDPHTYKALWSKAIDFDRHREKLIEKRDAVASEMKEYGRRVRLAAYVLKTGSFA